MSTQEPSTPPGWNPDRLPTPQLGTPPRWKPALIWMVPAVAALVAIALAVRALLNAGVNVDIMFKSASGLEANITEVRYKDVVVGMVKDISLSEALASASVDASHSARPGLQRTDTDQKWSRQAARRR